MKKLYLSLALLLLVCALSPIRQTSSQAATKKPKLNVRTLSLTENSSFHLRIYNITKKMSLTYYSTNPEVATVLPKGNQKKAVVTANTIGKCTIKIKVKKNKRVIHTLKCKILVSPRPISIKFSRKLIRIPVSSRCRARTIIKPNTAMELPLYESSNPSVATINSRGVITANAPGTATISATLLSTGQVTTCQVIVTAEIPTPTPEPVTERSSIYPTNEITFL